MKKKNEVDWSFIKFVSFLPRVAGFNVTKLAILSTAKHFEVHHEMPILVVELKRNTKSIMNVQFPSYFLSMSPNLSF